MQYVVLVIQQFPVMWYGREYCWSYWERMTLWLCFCRVREVTDQVCKCSSTLWDWMLLLWLQVATWMYYKHGMAEKRGFCSVGFAVKWTRQIKIIELFITRGVTVLNQTVTTTHTHPPTHCPPVRGTSKWSLSCIYTLWCPLIWSNIAEICYSWKRTYHTLSRGFTLRK